MHVTCMTIFHQYSNLFLEESIKCLPLNIAIWMHASVQKWLRRCPTRVQKKRAAEEASDTYIRHSITYQTVFILYSGMNTETYLP